MSPVVYEMKGAKQVLRTIEIRWFPLETVQRRPKMPGMHRRQVYRLSDAFERGRIIDLCEAGSSIRRVADHVLRDARTVGRFGE